MLSSSTVELLAIFVVIIFIGGAHPARIRRGGRVTLGATTHDRGRGSSPVPLGTADGADRSSRDVEEVPTQDVISRDNVSVSR